MAAPTRRQVEEKGGGTTTTAAGCCVPRRNNRKKSPQLQEKVSKTAKQGALVRRRASRARDRGRGQARLIEAIAARVVDSLLGLAALAVS